MRKKITLIGAGQIGGTLAHLISIKELGNVVLFDVAEGLAKGKALDIAQSTSVDGSNVNLIGTNSYKDTENSHVIIYNGHNHYDATTILVSDDIEPQKPHKLKLS